MITFSAVSKNYPRSGLALDRVSFRIRKGEFVFLTGHSGAGKSTVLNLIQMIERPTDGEVRVAEYSSRRMRNRDLPFLRRKLGIVFQDYRLLTERTAEENIAFALEVTGTRRREIRSRVGRLLAEVGLATKAKSTPHELSGGERQRVAIARALANQPLVLLADEPTGNLDEVATRGVFDLFRQINASGMTVLMATHDLELIRAHPGMRVIELKHGQVAFDSAVDAVQQEVP